MSRVERLLYIVERVPFTETIVQKMRARLHARACKRRLRRRRSLFTHNGMKKTRKLPHSMEGGTRVTVD